MSFSLNVRSALIGWIAGISVCAAMVAVCHWSYGKVRPDDANALLEQFLLRTSMMIDGLALLTFGIVLIDLVTPNDWLAKVGENAVACAIVISAICLTLAGIFIYS